MSIETNNYSDYEDFEPSSEEENSDLEEENSDLEEENSDLEEEEEEEDSDSEKRKVNYGGYIFYYFSVKKKFEIIKAPNEFYKLNDNEKKEKLLEIDLEFRRKKNKEEEAEEIRKAEEEKNTYMYGMTRLKVTMEVPKNENSLRNYTKNLYVKREDNGEIVYHYLIKHNSDKRGYHEDYEAKITPPFGYNSMSQEEKDKTFRKFEKIAREVEVEDAVEPNTKTKKFFENYDEVFNEMMGEKNEVASKNENDENENDENENDENENEKYESGYIDFRRYGQLTNTYKPIKKMEETKEELRERAKNMGFTKITKKTKNELIEMIKNKDELLKNVNKVNITKTKKELIEQAKELGYSNLHNLKKEEIFKLIESGLRIKNETKKDIVKRVKELGYKNVDNFKKEELKKLPEIQKPRKITKEDIMKRAKELGIKNVKNKTRKKLEELISEHDFKIAKPLTGLKLGKTGEN